MIKKETKQSSNILFLNISWTAVSTLIPICIALFTIPTLINKLGTEKFGILSIVWIVIGYFSLFDFGLSRSLTKIIAEKINVSDQKEIKNIVITALTLMVILGITGGIFSFLINSWLVKNVLQISPILRDEVLNTFNILSLSIPIVIISTGLKGILEGYQEFKLSSLIKLFLGAGSFLTPFAIVSFTDSLIYIVYALIILRLIILILYIITCNKKLYLFKDSKWTVDKKTTKELFKFGTWMTVSNITGPLLLYLGQFFIVSLISSEAVAYFSTPYEMMVKLLLIPTILVTVLFPKFVTLVQKDKISCIRLYKKSLNILFYIMSPLTLIIIFFSKKGLSIWINPSFADNSYHIAQVISLGVFINSFGHISQAFIQANNRPDLTAKLHLLELILYIPYCWFLTKFYYIEGAAFAWLIRVSISTLLLFYISTFFSKEIKNI